MDTLACNYVHRLQIINQIDLRFPKLDIIYMITLMLNTWQADKMSSSFLRCILYSYIYL